MALQNSAAFTELVTVSLEAQTRSTRKRIEREVLPQNPP
jgi:hypothetical protein